MTVTARRLKSPLILAAIIIAGCAGTPEPSAKETTPTSSEVEPGTNTGQGEAADSKLPTSLSLCPRMDVTNAPATNADRRVIGYQQFAVVNGTHLAIAPVEKACLSSGFGQRGEGLHKGIDLYNRDAVEIYSAANGRVKEKYYRDDYGNMLVIEHGDGVFARYAHLEGFASDLNVGDEVTLGQTIGVMGNTASYSIPRHLHYEVLTGEWGAFSGAFGLTPVDIFAHLP